ncbi:hypothetical protein AB0I53_35250 [Saccharopolyspora sp. NPDC050389]|uniref:hypothetical protein n=1 Tax=Saccharopolyspora sp. NPDC050389 TaxID=3155516 RepID=UPI0033E9BEE2
MSDHHFEPAGAADDQVRAAFRRAAAEAEQHASPLSAREITKRGGRRLRRQQLASGVTGAAAVVAITVAVTVATDGREQQPVVPAGPAPSLTAPVTSASSPFPSTSIQPTTSSTPTSTESR